MITPEIEELWEDKKGHKYMTFQCGYEINFVDGFGNFHSFEDVVHGEDGWKRVFPGVDYE